MALFVRRSPPYFYPRSPCGERPDDRQKRARQAIISIHALLAESDENHEYHLPDSWDFYPRSPCGERPYSQHVIRPSEYFYPRSPCGERRHGVGIAKINFAFLSTLSLRRATCLIRCRYRNVWPYFYPRSPCGERRIPGPAG